MNNKRYFILVIIILGIIVTIRNLGITHNFIGEDSGVVFDFPQPLTTFTYQMWDDFTAPGKANVTTTLNFIWLNLILFLYKIGLSNLFIKRFIYFAFFTTSGIGAFLLIKLILRMITKKSDKQVIYPSFIGSLIYLFNHFNMELLSFPINPYHVSYMLLPFLMYLFIKNIFIQTTFISTVLFILASLVLLSSNPANTIAIGLFFIAYFLYFSSDIKDKGEAVRFLLKSGVILLFLACYIILPNISVRNPYGFSGSQDDLLQSLDVHSVFTSFDYLLRLAAPADWDRYSYTKIYDSSLLILLGYLIPITAISSLLFKHYRKFKVFFAGTVIISLFLAKGSHVPFDNLFLFIFKSIPLFGIYRAAYPKFIYFAVISYAVLISLTIYFLYTKLKNERQKLFLSFLIPFIIFIYYFPYFTGQLLDRNNLTTIPNEYKNGVKILENDKSDYKVLALPAAPRGAGLLLQWGNNKYVGPHPDSFFLNRPVMDSYWFIDRGYHGLLMYDSWRGIKFEESIESLLHLAPFFNIKYILIHKDFLNEYLFGENNLYKIDGTKKAEVLLKKMNQIKGIHRIENNKFFVIYKLPESYVYPKIYLPEKIISSNEPLQYLLTSYDNKLPDQRTLITKKDHTVSTDALAKLSYQKNSPTSYTLFFTNINHPTSIVFSETYHPNWKLSKVNQSNHFEANGFANGWNIDPDQICKLIKCKKNSNGNYDFVLQLTFQPQSLFILGLSISTVSLVALLVSLIYMNRSKINYDKKIKS